MSCSTVLRYQGRHRGDRRSPLASPDLGRLARTSTGLALTSTGLALTGGLVLAASGPATAHMPSPDADWQPGAGADESSLLRAVVVAEATRTRVVGPWIPARASHAEQVHESRDGSGERAGQRAWERAGEGAGDENRYEWGAGKAAGVGEGDNAVDSGASWENEEPYVSAEGATDRDEDGQGDGDDQDRQEGERDQGGEPGERGERGERGESSQGDDGYIADPERDERGEPGAHGQRDEPGERDTDDRDDMKPDAGRELRPGDDPSTRVGPVPGGVLPVTPAPSKTANPAERAPLNPNVTAAPDKRRQAPRGQSPRVPKPAPSAGRTRPEPAQQATPEPDAPGKSARGAASPKKEAPASSANQVTARKKAPTVGKPATPAKPATSAKPATPTKPVKPVKPATPPKAVTPAKAGVVGIASGLQGIPYVWGGTSTKGFDCSGFTQHVFRKAGIELPRTAAQQQKATTKVSEPKPGDLVFFGAPAYHVGVYAGGGKMYDAPRRGKTTGLRTIWSSNVTYGRAA